MLVLKVTETARLSPHCSVPLVAAAAAGGAPPKLPPAQEPRS